MQYQHSISNLDNENSTSSSDNQQLLNSKHKRNELTKENSIKKKRKKHSKYELDNLKVKLLIHFCNFIICFMNDYIKMKFNYQKRKLRKISYEIKKSSSKKGIAKLMNLTIEEFCNLNVSKKYKIDQGSNRKNFEEIKFDLDNGLLKYKLLNFYKRYYLELDSKKIERIKKDFGLSEKTENFKSFYTKQDDELMIIRLFNVAKNILYNKEKIKTVIFNVKQKKNPRNEIESILLGDDDFRYDIDYDPYLESSDFINCFRDLDLQTNNYNIFIK